MQIQVVTALPSAARTVSGIVDLGALPGGFAEMNIYIDVTAAAGTSPSLIVTYQCSAGGFAFYDHTAGVAITAVGRQLLKLPNNIGNYGRIIYDITGTTPSFTFAVVAEAKRNN